MRRDVHSPVDLPEHLQVHGQARCAVGVVAHHFQGHFELVLDTAHVLALEDAGDFLGAADEPLVKALEEVLCLGGTGKALTEDLYGGRLHRHYRPQKRHDPGERF